MGANQYTPTTEDVRALYVLSTPAHRTTTATGKAEFDRWLEQVRADAVAEATQARHPLSIARIHGKWVIAYGETDTAPEPEPWTIQIWENGGCWYQQITGARGTTQRWCLRNPDGEWEKVPCTPGAEETGQ